METSRKKLTVSWTREATIPTVVRIDRSAARARIALITSSPQRRR
jgi:hypothetical protein